MRGITKAAPLKRLLLERGATSAASHCGMQTMMWRGAAMLEDNPSEHVVEELLWSAADHGCPEIVAMALPHMQWPRTIRAGTGC